ncbi:MAG: purine-nucleoside phosphorylase [Saprospiraceae bacterium]|nr:purine-nucleoside phosphorylase [Saprospiraceae bacterium]
MLPEKIASATSSIIEQTDGWKPQVAVVLGSGFADWVNTIEVIHHIPYEQIRGFPSTTVDGHKGTLVTGRVGQVSVIVMQGRFHYYEGHSMRDLSIPVRVFRDLGVETLFLTNAAGAINTEFVPGNLMLIQDHINLVGNNPLIGLNLERYGLRFPDAASIYTPALQDLASEIADEMNLDLKKGVYVFTTGPSFETPAEIRMMRTIGADVVGMSTVPEAIVANHAGMQVFGLSLVSNYGSGMSPVVLTHEEVMETMSKVSIEANQFINMIISRLGS